MRYSAAALALGLLLALPAAGADDPLQAAVANPARTDKDRERDPRDKPAEVMQFAGVKPGMVVADVWGAGGYWTELLSYAVGPDGRVLLINNVPYANFARDGLKARFTPDRLPNVTRRLADPGYMQLAPASLDLAIIVMSYHDLYYVDENDGWPAVDRDRFVSQIHAALKPGGRLLIVDHAAVAGTGPKSAQDLHRIDEAFVREDLAARGFAFDKSYDGLRNADDDHTKLVFDPAIRGKTDRFVHLYRKI